LLFSVCDAPVRPWARVRLATICCEVVRAAPASLRHALGPAPGAAGQRWGAGCDPRSPSRGGLCGSRVREDALCQERQCGQTLAAGGGEHALPHGPSHLLGPEGQPLHGPAVLLHCLPLRPAEGQGCVEQQGLSKTWGVDDHTGKSRRPWGSVRQHHGVPELRADEAGRLSHPSLPGLAPVGGGGGKPMPLGTPGQRTHHSAFARAASLAAVCREPGTPGRAIGGTATDVACDSGCLERCEGKTASCHQGFVRGEERLGLVEQPSLHGSFRSLVRVGPYKQAGQG